MMETRFTEKDFAAIKRSYAELHEIARKRCASQEELDLVRKAFEMANDAHANVRRRSGDPHILHCIGVAKIVVQDLGLGYKSICAALLHDIFDDTDYSAVDISGIFGEKVASLVEGLSKLKSVLDNENSKNDESVLQDEQFRIILLTLGGDVRVVLIKLADRLHNCRNIECIPEYKREKVLTETMNIFIPLAHRLGLYGIKSEMENIWLRFKEPVAYDRITRQISDATRNHERFIDDFLSPICIALDSAGIEYSIRKRIKTPYSVWYKINHKNVSFDQISDLFAARIIFKPKSQDIDGERNECFQIFSIITSVYRYRPDRVRNWLMHPKPNGYEALHLTCITADDTNVEIQIRSKRMDDIAEQGITAHWNYKRIKPVSEENPVDIWLAGVKDALQSSDITSLDMLDLNSGSNAVSDIFVFDDKDNIHTLPRGATALDYANAMGITQTGKILAVKVNYHLSGLSTVLSSGDKVELVTTNS